MTTAHRPTFHNALGGDNQGGNFLVAPSTKVSSRDLPGHTTLKVRHVRPPPMYTEDVPQDSSNYRGDFKEALEQKERQNREKKDREKAMYGPVEALSEVKKKLLNPVPKVLLPDAEENPFPEDEDDYGSMNSHVHGGRTSKQDDDDDESSSSDDDEEELMRELEKIKRERQQEQLKQKQKEEQSQESEERLRILKANPLILEGSGVLKRRWDDDVVFRNQAKNLPKPKKRFINDTVRSDFHRKFLARYIQ